MKKMLITIAITSAITSQCWYIAMGMRVAYDQTWLISAVKAPGRVALEEIETDLRHGNIADASKKLQILKAEWKRFEESDGIGSGIGNIMVEFTNAPVPEEEQ